MRGSKAVVLSPESSVTVSISNCASHPAVAVKDIDEQKIAMAVFCRIVADEFFITACAFSLMSRLYVVEGVN